ncbi:unnamed protein product, partial [Nesidiocoris tenuis]
IAWQRNWAVLILHRRFGLIRRRPFGAKRTLESHERLNRQPPKLRLLRRPIVRHSSGRRASQPSRGFRFGGTCGTQPHDRPGWTRPPTARPASHRRFDCRIFQASRDRPFTRGI